VGWYYNPLTMHSSNRGEQEGGGGLPEHSSNRGEQEGGRGATKVQQQQG